VDQRFGVSLRQPFDLPTASEPSEHIRYHTTLISVARWSLARTQSSLGAVPTRRKSARSPVDATVAARRSAYRRPRLYGM